jgi:hypothetical protein
MRVPLFAVGGDGGDARKGVRRAVFGDRAQGRLAVHGCREHRERPAGVLDNRLQAEAHAKDGDAGLCARVEVRVFF